MKVENIFKLEVKLKNNLIFKNDPSVQDKNQKQTQEIFSEKWSEFEKGKQKQEVYKFQREWFLKLYGFSSEEALKDYLTTTKIILDAGCGLGYKAAWFAELAPHAKVIAIDISDSIFIAAKNYKNLKNLFFYQSDISNTGIKSNQIDFTVCDQVIMHTENPEKTFNHLTNLTSISGEFACYVYRKKALPRELVDDYFRKATHDIPSDQVWEMSAQLTELGKRLSELDVCFEAPEIPLLGIKAGTYDIQRFIYWNFIKCFYRENWGKEMCDATNFDWYAPSNAKRYSKEEFKTMIEKNNLKIGHFHEEEACYSGRFLNKK
jgi:ubiquinone/menaquinone biosynthesis C-methylase UbiE